MFSIFGRKIDNFFEIIGTNEDDISKAIGWTMYKSPNFLDEFLKIVNINEYDNKNTIIELQDYEKKHGFSDIEISDSNNFHCIIEAKKGLNYPGEDQLLRYASKSKYKNQDNLEKRIISLSEANQQYVTHRIKHTKFNDYEYSHLSWTNIIQVCRRALKRSKRLEKRLLNELLNYMKGINNMQNINSNEVYCVVINNNIYYNNVTFMDVVNKQKMYFHPVGDRYPYYPPNYLGIRYYGQLQNVYKIESYNIVDTLEGYIDGMNGHKFEKPHFLYRLGNQMSPPSRVENGDIFPSAGMMIHLDLLLFSSSIREAFDLTKERIQNSEHN